MKCPKCFKMVDERTLTFNFLDCPFCKTRVSLAYMTTHPSISPILIPVVIPGGKL